MLLAKNTHRVVKWECISHYYRLEFTYYQIAIILGNHIFLDFVKIQNTWKIIKKNSEVKYHHFYIQDSKC